MDRGTSVLWRVSFLLVIGATINLIAALWLQKGVFVSAIALAAAGIAALNARLVGSERD